MFADVSFVVSIVKTLFVVIVSFPVVVIVAE